MFMAEDAKNSGLQYQGSVLEQQTGPGPRVSADGVCSMDPVVKAEDVEMKGESSGSAARPGTQTLLGDHQENRKRLPEWARKMLFVNPSPTQEKASLIYQMVEKGTADNPLSFYDVSSKSEDFSK